MKAFIMCLDVTSRGNVNNFPSFSNVDVIAVPFSTSNGLRKMKINERYHTNAYGQDRRSEQ